MGAVLGLALGALGSYGAAKERQKQASRQRSADLMLQMGLQSGDPNFFKQPEVQKVVGEVYGKDFATKALPDLSAAFNKPISGFPQMPGTVAPSTMGMAMGRPTSTVAGPPSGAAAMPSAGTAGTSTPAMHPGDAFGPHDDAGTWQKYYDALEQYTIANPNNERGLRLAKQEMANAKYHIDLLQKQAVQTQREKVESPEYKANVASEEEKAREKIKHSPENVAAETREAAAKSTAERNAAIAAETSPAAVSAEANRAAQIARATATVHAQVAANAEKAWTQRDAISAKSAALTQAKSELAGTTLFGLKAKPLEGSKVAARAREILTKEGLDPDTGMRIKVNGRDIIPNPKSPSGFDYADTAPKP